MDNERKDKLEGKAKEAEGKLTGDKVREGQGKAEHAWGEAKEGADEARDKVREKI
jgi:uncharacterized protein YjbJ (UPF0337 family)